MEGKRSSPFALCMVLVVSIFIGCTSHQWTTSQKEATDGKLPLAEASSLWKHITAVDPYRNWDLYPPKKGLYPSMRRGLTPAKNPHGAYLKLYGNKTALQAAGESEHEPMPNGAILIMEDYGKDKKTLKSITVMYKVKGYNPAEGDWFWGSYGPAGQVMDSGKVESCIECHRTQYKHDWRFTGAMPHH
jgi:hypothetical protein